MKFLLDTCTFLWLCSEQEKLSSSAKAALDDPTNELHFSDLSIWEIVLKHTAGKLPMPDKPRRWIPLQMAFHRLITLPVHQPAIFRAADLPLIHPDPFDRLLAAQALESGFTILSPDKSLSALGAARVW